MRKIKRQELLLLAAWLIIIVAVAGEFAVSRTKAKFSRLNDEIGSAEEKLIRLQAILNQKDTLILESAAVLSDYKPIQDTDRLFEEIDAVAKKLNVNVYNKVPLQPKPERGYTVYSVKIDCQDEVSSIAKFLFTLIEQLRTVSIERLQIVAQNRDELPKVSIVLNGLGFDS